MYGTFKYHIAVVGLHALTLALVVPINGTTHRHPRRVTDRFAAALLQPLTYLLQVLPLDFHHVVLVPYLQIAFLTQVVVILAHER